MTDKKISELTEITGANTASDDYFVIVDTSADETKKISREELNNAIERDDLSNVTITGGTIDGTVIGGTTPAAGTFTSGTFTGDVSFGDNDKAIFGAGSDLQIYHDGSHSYITDVGAGSLYIRGAQNIEFQNGSGAETYARFVTNGTAKLFYDSSEKFATTSTGINVTGTVTADGLTIDSSGTIRLNHATADDFLTITQGGTQAVITAGSAAGAANLLFKTTAAGVDTNAMQLFSNGDISFYEDTGTTAKFFWDASAERLGLGTSSPAAKIDVVSDTAFLGKLTATNGYIDLIDPSVTGRLQVSGNVFYVGTAASGDMLVFKTGSSTERMRIDSSGRVGIGTSSPASGLHIVNSGLATQLRISNTTADATTKYGTVLGSHYTNSEEPITGMLLTSSSSSTGGTVSIGGGISTANAVNNIVFYTAANNTTLTGSERMRIDSSGNVMVGKTSFDSSIEGVMFDDRVFATKSGAATAIFNRLTSDGDIVTFRKDGTNVGSIGAVGGSVYISSPQGSDAGLQFGNSIVGPASVTGGNRDNAIDLGWSANRFDDIYATNGTIQTSDQNEKQDIEALSEAEQRVAVAAKGLLRKFRWIDSVEEKGDDARIHFGIIAQDLQAAFEAEGLDAGRYAMFINSNWTDEETGEERSRMGVRYNQLLAFIIAAI